MHQHWLASYPPGMPAEIDVQRFRSLVELFRNTVERFPHKPAFANFGTVLSYAEIDALSRRFAAYLTGSLGLETGERIAIMMPNILQYPVILYGALRAGMIVVNVNPLYTARELRHQLADSGVRVIVILEHFAHVLQDAIDGAELEVEQVVTTQVGDLLKFPSSLLINSVLRHVKRAIPQWRIDGARALKSVLAEGARLNHEDANPDSDDIAFLQYTGGTTGISKGVILTHGNVSANVVQARTWVGESMVDGEEISITALPLYHIFSLTANCLYITAIGGLNVLISNPRDFRAFVKELKRWKFTFITGVNTLYAALLNTPGFEHVDFSHLKFSLGGGMAVTRPVAERWKRVTGKVLIEIYGLSETSPAVCMNRWDLDEYNGSIGLPVPSTQVCIVDDQEQAVPIGEAGELCVRGPQVTQGYWNRPDETRRLFTADGWMKTGDYATIDERGYVWILDRMNDMINVSGFNVYPNEIEDVVDGHPGVREVAAIGVADDKSGARVRLFVVRGDDALCEADILEYCRERLASYKVPREVIFRDHLPKSAVGKILRRALRAD